MSVRRQLSWTNTSLPRSAGIGLFAGWNDAGDPDVLDPTFLTYNTTDKIFRVGDVSDHYMAYDAGDDNIQLQIAAGSWHSRYLGDRIEGRGNGFAVTVPAGVSINQSLELRNQSTGGGIVVIAEDGGVSIGANDGNFVITVSGGGLQIMVPDSPAGLSSGSAYWNSNVLTRLP